MSGQAPASTTYYFRYDHPFVDGCAGLECTVWSLTNEAAVIAGVLLSVIVVLQAFVVLAAATDRCREEYDRTRAELTAFARFADRVSALTPSTSVQVTSGPADNLFIPDDGGGVEAVASAYRETVMAVPHYEEDYGDSLYESVRAEFGVDTAEALRSNRSLSPTLKASLLGGCQRALRDRRGYLAAVAGELDAIDEADDRLRELEDERHRARETVRSAGVGPTGALADAWDDLEAIEAACDALIDDRRGSFDAADRTPPSPAFYEYLYAPLEGATYPIIAEAVALIDRVRAVQDEAVSRLAWQLH